MPLINVPVGIAPCQIDDFPKTVGKDKDARPFERSCKGALFLRPASSKVVTQDELDHIKGHGAHKMLARRLVVVRVDIVTDESDRSRMKVTEAQKAKTKEKVKALPTAGSFTELAAEVTEKAELVDESSKESGGSRSSRRRRGGS